MSHAAAARENGEATTSGSSSFIKENTVVGRIGNRWRRGIGGHGDDVKAKLRAWKRCRWCWCGVGTYNWVSRQSPIHQSLSGAIIAGTLFLRKGYASHKKLGQHERLVLNR